MLDAILLLKAIKCLHFTARYDANPGYGEVFAELLSWDAAAVLSAYLCEIRLPWLQAATFRFVVPFYLPIILLSHN